MKFSRALAFKSFVMPRRALVRAARMTTDQSLVSRVPRLQNLATNVEKMKIKDERTYTGEDNVVFVHRWKKRKRLSAQEKDQVCCIVQNL